MRAGCDGLVLLQRVRKCYEKNVENGEYLQALLLFHFSKNNILGTVSAVIHLLSSTFSDLWFFIKTVRVLELFLILIYNPNMISFQIQNGSLCWTILKYMQGSEDRLISALSLETGEKKKKERNDDCIDFLILSGM